MIQFGDIVIRPTGTCFDDAIDLIEKWVNPDPKAEDWHKVLRLVHGILLHEDDNDPYAHAWVERLDRDGWQVWQGGLCHGTRIDYAVDRDEYYEKMQIQEKTVYTLREMAIENLRYNNFGPWKREYLLLTTQGKAGIDNQLDNRGTARDIQPRSEKVMSGFRIDIEGIRRLFPDDGSSHVRQSLHSALNELEAARETIARQAEELELMRAYILRRASL